MNPQLAKSLQEARTPMPSIVLCNNTITAESAIRNVGVILDSRLDSSARVSAIIKACNYHLSQIAHVRQYITESACKLAVLGLVISRLDYCNGLLCAATDQQLHKLQLVQNRAARLVVRAQVPHGQIVHITLILKQLHWLPVKQRVRYKLCLIVHNSLHGTGPQYLRELLKLYVQDERLWQASNLQLVLCHPKRKVGRAGFSVAGPDGWHTLPAAIRSIDSKDTFVADSLPVKCCGGLFHIASVLIIMCIFLLHCKLLLSILSFIFFNFKLFIIIITVLLYAQFYYIKC